MSSDGKKLKNLTGTSQNDNKISTIFPSSFYPGNDEIQVREFAKLHQEIPVVKGSFSKCRNNGILTNYDMKLMNQVRSSCFQCTFSSAILGLIFTLFLQVIDKLPNMKKSRNYLMFGLGGALVGGLFSLYQYRKEIHQLDKKYTPLWLKSIGKI
jgi:hypothetical protein